MNVFVIILMTAMFATYQYYMSRRSAGAQFNRREMEMRVELNCLRRYHDYAVGLNEKIASASDAGYYIDEDFPCAGAESIKSYKYCLSSGGALAGCSAVGDDGWHCVSTTRTEPYPSDLKSLLFKMNLYEVRSGTLGERPIPRTQWEDEVGMATCVPALKAEARRLGNMVCSSGFFAQMRENGEFECAPIPRPTPCTAHEEEADADGAYMRQNCTEITAGALYCCAKEPGNICGLSGDFRAVWHSAARAYRCTNGDDACPVRAEMLLRNELGDDTPDAGIEAGGTIARRTMVSRPYVAKYDYATRMFECAPSSAAFIDACKKVADATEHVFDRVDDVRAGRTPKCRLFSKKAAAAKKGCSACGVVRYVGGEFVCSYITSFEGVEALGEEGYDSLAASGCFKGCSAYAGFIKEGLKNGRGWGVAWRDSSKMWECFTCGETGFNRACESGTCDRSDGMCVLADCDLKYQTRQADGLCYTRWCRNIPREVDARVGAPTARDCKAVRGYPYMAYNSEEGWNCAYCTRTPPASIK